MMAAMIAANITIANADSQFINLSADEVRIDSAVPYYSCTKPIEGSFQDSTYTVEIVYPEFTDMTRDEIERYKAISGRKLPEMPEVESYVTVSRRKGMLDISFVPLVKRGGRMQKLTSFMLKVKAEAKNMTARKAPRRATAADRYAAHSVLSSGQWAKIRVGESGIYQLTADVVSKAGFTDINKVKIYGYGGALVPEKLTAEYLTDYDDLKEVPTCTIEGKRLFYAQGPLSWNKNQRIRNPYSSYGYYLITESDETPATLSQEEFVSLFYPADIDYNTIYEIDDYAWFQGGRNLYDATELKGGSTTTYTLAAAGTSATGTITVSLTSDRVASATISVNDSVVGTINVTEESNAVANVSTKTFNLKNIQPENTVTIVRNSSASTMRLDYISLYTNSPKAAPDLTTIVPKQPEYVYNITNQDLHADSTADMIIIIPATQKLRAYAEQIKAHHEEKDSMTVRIVPADELFNEFSSGTPDASAYRRYMKMLYDREDDVSNAPKYLLLFGDAAWDNRMILSQWSMCSPDDFLLCFESENSFSETDCYVSDDFFCLLDDEETIETPGSTDNTRYRGKPDVAVGRFPVQTAEQAAAMVQKTIDYANNKYAGAWQNTLVFMGDDGNYNVHMKDVDAIATRIEQKHPAFNVKRIMWDAYKRTSSATGNRYPDVEKLIKQYMNSGALIMNYMGHGAPYTISHEMVVYGSDFANAKSQGLPLWVTASCDIMPFDGTVENIGELAVFNPNGGAVAFFGTTRTVITTYNKKINEAFTTEVIKAGMPIGEAVRTTKCSLVNSGSDRTPNKLQYSLLGDPALVLARPMSLATIDSINGQATGTGNTMSFKAGQKITLKGHVNDTSGTIDSTYYGIATIAVRDVAEEIVCMVNDPGEVDKPFQFKDRQSTIFSGSDSVSRGKFAFTFTVPKDISYSNGTGQMLVYTIDNEHKQPAQGVNEEFVLNGTEIATRDTIGPAIYCYLNTPTFNNGDFVNPSPYFFAQLNDDDGINASGSGIGHNIEIIIDNDTYKTYNLNEYFSFDFGSYTSGSVSYQIPQLEQGYHQMTFRAWDILNNVSTTELSFNVMYGLEPAELDVQYFASRNSHTGIFRLFHDRAGCPMQVILDVFDVSGRQVYSHTESGTPTDNTYTINWNPYVNGGSALQTGVYVYRVRVSCEGSNYVSKAKKMIIVSNI